MLEVGPTITSQWYLAVVAIQYLYSLDEKRMEMESKVFKKVKMMHAWEVLENRLSIFASCWVLPTPLTDFWLELIIMFCWILPALSKVSLHRPDREADQWQVGMRQTLSGKLELLFYKKGNIGKFVVRNIFAQVFWIDLSSQIIAPRLKQQQTITHRPVQICCQLIQTHIY